MQKLRRLMPLAAVAVLALVAAGCGSGGGGSTGGGAGTQSTSGKTGGTVTLLDAAGSVDSLDPGYWYYQTDYEELGQTTQRWLYSWKPKDNVPTPDIAQGPPQISNGGKTLTIKIKSGIKYSPPLQNQTVKAADIKYAMERCFAAPVGNGYAFSYYSGIQGAPSAPTSKVKDISGIQAPDDNTLVLQLKQPVGILANANALGLPCTIPVPKNYAAKFDNKSQSTYGQHQVFTGPYMIEGAGSGTVSKAGYQPAKLISLVRNPSWDKSTDFKPAYFDKIIIKNGSDVTVASRQILSGTSMMSGDYAVPPPAVLKEGLTTKKDQFQISPSGGNRYFSLNTTVKPFDNLNVRRAVAAATNRNALRQTRGGPAVGTVATHFIPPLIPGFDQAGGNAGPGYDFYKNPNGDLKLAASYLKKAGYPSGKYTGGETVLMVTDSAAAQKKVAEVAQQSMQSLGFHVSLRAVERSTMYSKFCSVPKAKVAVCPSVGWLKDFADAQTVLDPTFNGKNIIPSNNSNWPQLNDPAINKAMDSAETILDPAKRAEAWGKIDDMVTAAAPGVLWLWDKGPSIMSKNVNGVLNKENASWDLSFTSLK